MIEFFKYGLEHMSVELSLKIARNLVKGIIDDRVKKKITENFNIVQNISKGEKLIYSINTGFGSLCKTKISSNKIKKLQENLLKSHSVGVGLPIDQEIAKLMLILKVHTLSQGFSGISIEIIERICWHIDNDYIPLVPRQGSVGASGDLAPLAHAFLPLIGLGYLSNDGKNYVSTKEIFNKYNLKPLTLQAKEGLALINGTQFMTALAIKISEKGKDCLDHADIIGALTLEAYLGSHKPFDERLIKLRPHNGAIITGDKFRKFLQGSNFMKSHEDCGRIQDPYSIRCIPQVHGASRDALLHFNEKLDCEMNSITDNPIIFDEDDVINGGNFHGQPLALPLDYVGLAISEMGNISDRRIYLLLEGKWGLPPYLIKDSGINSGFMITQYCSAALASENKTMCFPASADSIPTSMGQEDHVSMGPISARKTLKIINNLEKIIAIELICAAQAFDFRKPLKSSNFLEACHQLIREKIPHVSEDLIMSELINLSIELIKSKDLLNVPLI